MNHQSTLLQHDLVQIRIPTHAAKLMATPDITLALVVCRSTPPCANQIPLMCPKARQCQDQDITCPKSRL